MSALPPNTCVLPGARGDWVVPDATATATTTATATATAGKSGGDESDCGASITDNLGGSAYSGGGGSHCVVGPCDEVTAAVCRPTVGMRVRVLGADGASRAGMVSYVVRAYVLGCRMKCLILGLGFRVNGSGFRPNGVGLRAHGSGWRGFFDNFSRGTQGYIGVHRGTQGYAGIHRCTQGYTGVRRGYTGVHRGTQGYAEVHRGTQGYTGVNRDKQLEWFPTWQGLMV